MGNDTLAAGSGRRRSVILHGVALVSHTHSVVHREINPAGIFFTNHRAVSPSATTQQEATATNKFTDRSVI